MTQRKSLFDEPNYIPPPEIYEEACRLWKASAQRAERLRGLIEIFNLKAYVYKDNFTISTISEHLESTFRERLDYVNDLTAWYWHQKEQLKLSTGRPIDKA